ncbi:MAG: LysE family translocator [Hyphomicrobium sp.]
MPLDVFLSALAFVFVASFTPGPNNTMLLASGVNYGFTRTLPHILGIVIGYGVMFAALALGIGRVVAIHPQVFDALKIASALYLGWLAWKIATAARPVPRAGESQGESEGTPLTFLQAALFQWINPKGVGMGLAASANFLRPDQLAKDLPAMLALVFFMSLTSASTWALFGQGLREFLQDETRRIWFNRIMALALLASLWPLFSHGLSGVAVQTRG